jgi:hypothetical protein
MVDRDPGSVPIEVDLGSPLRAMALASCADDLECRLVPDVQGLLERFGIPGRPTVRVRVTAGGAALSVRAHEQALPCNLAAATRAWRAVASDDARLRLRESRSGARDHDGRISEAIATLRAIDPSGRSVVEFLARHVVELLATRPQRLMVRAQIMGRLREVCTAAGRPSDRRSVDALLEPVESLLAFGVSVGDVVEIVATADAAKRRRLPPGDLGELVLERLRPDVMDVRGEPSYLAAITGAPESKEAAGMDVALFDDQARTDLGRLNEHFLDEVGVPLPLLRFIPDCSLHGTTVEIVVNHRLPLRFSGLPPRNLFTTAPPEVLKELGIEGSPYEEPVWGTTGALLSVDSARSLTAEANVLSPFTLMTVAVHKHAREHADELLALNDVEGRLGELRRGFPHLVDTVLEMISLGDLTRVLRRLLREGLSIRDLRTLLDRLVRYEDVAVDDAELVPLDGRLPVGPVGELRTQWWHYHEFVRGGMASFFAHRYASAGVLSAIRLDPAWERKAAEAPGGLRAGDFSTWVAEDEREELIDAVRRAALGTSNGDLPAVVIAPTTARIAIRDVLADDFPDLAVIAYYELPPSVCVRTVRAAPPAVLATN